MRFGCRPHRPHVDGKGFREVHHGVLVRTWEEYRALARDNATEVTTERGRRLGLGATLAAMLPAVAAAAEVSESEVEIKTPDGTCDAHFVHPAKATAAVLVWPDIWGLRPAFRAMGTRLAESGYAVLTVNPFYRSIKGQPA
jgi:hypothetical protein